MQTPQKDDLKRKGLLSTMSLFFQSGYSAVLGLIANLILTILLSPHIFGIYITVLSLIAFLNYFSDVGLAASLIQKKEISKDDVKTTFTMQQILILTVIMLGFSATPFIQNFYQLPQGGVYLYWSLLTGFFLSSLKTIPSVFLERKIRFQKIVLVQVVENTVFYSAVSLLALSGFGIASFTFAVILRSVVGLVMIYSISFWRPQLGISLTSLKSLLSFGLPYQASSFLALFKDDLIILYLGKVLGFEGLGYIGWAKKWADAPLRIVMDNIGKVIFPLIARIQDDLEKVKNLFEKVLYYQTALLAPVFIGMILLMGKFIEVVPNYLKWQQALPIFYIFALSSLIISLFAPFMNLFNALGKVKITFTLMALATLVMWFATPLLTELYGLYGFPIAHLLVSLTFALAVVQAKKLLKFNLFAIVSKFLLTAAAMGAAVYFLQNFLAGTSFLILFLYVGSGIIIYFLLLSLFFNFDLLQEFNSFLKVVKKRK